MIFQHCLPFIRKQLIVGTSFVFFLSFLGSQWESQWSFPSLVVCWWKEEQAPNLVCLNCSWTPGSVGLHLSGSPDYLYSASSEMISGSEGTCSSEPGPKGRRHARAWEAAERKERKRGGGGEGEEGKGREKKGVWGGGEGRREQREGWGSMDKHQHPLAASLPLSVKLQHLFSLHIHFLL